MDVKKILVVDDDEDILRLYSFMLDKSGYKAKTVDQAGKVMDELATGEYSVAILDILMPEISGVELLKLIKEKHPEIQVIMNTAYSSIDTAEKALNIGAFSYLTKPIKKEELLASVEKAYNSFSVHKKDDAFIKNLKNIRREDTIVYVLLIIDCDSRKIKNANYALEKLLGYQKGDLIGGSIDKILQTEGNEIFHKEQIEKKKLSDHKMQFINSDGDKVSIIFNGSIMKDEEKNILGMVGMCSKVK